ncbi:kinase-like domain-containing protein [Rhizophagus clarus]|uniref:Kinase-like domain-containing protein n=1 Tax=Rhizophagus clarus TaxID=94130 RepID=A0A8H3LTH4_9GLOM|nr:kinase-like domain-containing protein [Rhizophagus clarus]
MSLQRNYERNFTNRTSGNEEIDKFIQVMQLNINKNSPDMLFEWIPYNLFYNIKEIFKGTIYSAKWKDGPLYRNNYNHVFTRKLDINVTLKCLHDSQNVFDEISTKVNNLNNILKVYGISQNPDTNNYIMVLEDEYKKHCMKCDQIYTNIYYKWCRPCEMNCLEKGSGNEKIDNFIQEMQLQIIYPTDTVLEWIPYSQLVEIEEIGNEICSAKWTSGPLYWKDKKYIREQSKEVVFKYLELISITDESLIEYKNDLLKSGIKIYGISQNLDKYIMILQDEHCKRCGNIYTDRCNKWCKECQINYLRKNFTNWTSGNKEMNKLIQEMQLKIDKYDDIVFEWVHYDQFNDIKEIVKSGFATVCSAKWRDGPLHYNVDEKKYTRNLNKTIALKYSHNSQNINKFLDEIKKCLKINFKIYGISQNSKTKDYIMVLHNKYLEKEFENYCVICNGKYANSVNKWCKSCQIKYLESNFTSWTSGNKNIDDFIQGMQLKIKSPFDKIFEWIPYSQFNNFKEIDNNKLFIVSLAKWKNGLLYWDNDSKKYIRKLSIKVSLKCLRNSQNVIDEVKLYLKDDIKDNITNIAIYGISQNPDTREYILVFHNEYCVKCENFTNWTSNNKEIDDFIQEKQLKIVSYNNIVFEWIPYHQFINIKVIGEDSFATIYSAKWQDGLLYWNKDNRKYTRKLDTTVVLKCLHNIQNNILNEIELDSEIYGISQNPNTKNYIIILQNGWYKPCQIMYLKENLMNRSGNDEIDNFIQKVQSNTKKPFDIIFEWIPYNQLNNFEKINNEFLIIYSAKWKDGPLYWNSNNKEYIRKSDTKVTLKCLKYTTNEFINEISMYLKNNYNEAYTNLTIYGISQNPNTKNYIVIFHEEFCVKCNKIYTNTWNKWCKPCHLNYLKNDFTNRTSKNKNIDKLIQEMQLNINDPSDIIFEWIPYNQLSDIKEINKSNIATIYTSIWKDGPLYWNGMMYKRDSHKKVALKCLNNLKGNPDEFLSNKVKEYSINSYNNNIYGISQNADYYIIVLQDNYYKDHCLKCNEIYTNIFYKWCKPCQIKGFACFISENEKIDNYIQEMQLRNNSDLWDSNSWDKVFEWIPYNQFHNIKLVNKDDFSIVYSAKWINGPLYYNINKNKYMRSSEKSVALRCLSQNITSDNDFLSEVKTYLFNLYGILEVYGISRNPVTKDYIMVIHDKYFDKEFEKYCVKCAKIYADIQYRWCKSCQTDRLKKNFKEWTSGNKKIDDFIQDMQSKINDLSDIVFEWIPYEQFDDIEEIDKGGFATVYSAIWKKGPLFYNLSNKNYTRHENKLVALKCLYNSQNITNEFLKEIKEYSINKFNCNILRIYGLSQNPSTKEYIIILEYAEGGNFNKWVNNNWDNFSWLFKINTLLNISNGLKKIHQRKAVHRDLHTGNILFFTKNINVFSNSIISISDMGLCGEVSNVKDTNIYGVMPYVAPEVLRGNPYTQAADIYSFEAPKCYIDLMKKCWDPNPDNRKDSNETYDLILKFRKSYVGGVFITDIYDNEIEIQFEKAEEYRKANLNCIIIPKDC